MAQSRRKNRKGHRRRRLSRGRVWALVLFIVLGVGGLAVVQAQLATPRVGELNAQGLRLTPSGRSDASHVMEPLFFPEGRVREAYAIAQKIPETLNQLYCWCGCTQRGLHRSALECFESMHAAACDVCLANAEVAREMTQKGVTDAAEIQAVLDAQYGRV